VKVIILSAILWRQRGHSEQASEQGLHTARENHAVSKKETQKIQCTNAIQQYIKTDAYSKSVGKEAILQLLQIRNRLCRHVNCHLCHPRHQYPFPSSLEF
jgi:hypothetical protein